jgi:hypothetical protein
LPRDVSSTRAADTPTLTDPELQARTTNPNDRLLTPAEAAKFLRKSISFLAKARMSGTGPEYVKIGSHVFYWMSKLLEYLSKRSRRSTSDSGKIR